ncbi:MAG: hypothetical protein ACT4PG_04195 [Panacagrimonas sp.]
MSKTQSEPANPPQTEDGTEASAAAAPVKRSAMKLPEGVVPAGSRGPQQRKNWTSEHGGRPQTDFARRAGKSRKVH